MLITKPGRVVGVRGCELSVPLLKLAEEKLGYVRSAISVSWNDKTGRITFTTESEVNTGSSSQPRMSMVAQTSNNGPIGYIYCLRRSQLLNTWMFTVGRRFLILHWQEF